MEMDGLAVGWPPSPPKKTGMSAMHCTHMAEQQCCILDNRRRWRPGELWHNLRLQWMYWYTLVTLAVASGAEGQGAGPLGRADPHAQRRTWLALSLDGVVRLTSWLVDGYNADTTLWGCRRCYFQTVGFCAFGGHIKLRVT